MASNLNFPNTERLMSVGKHFLPFPFDELNKTFQVRARGKARTSPSIPLILLKCLNPTKTKDLLIFHNTTITLVNKKVTTWTLGCHWNLLTVLYTMMPRTCSSMVLPRSRRLRYCVPVSASLQDRDRHNRSSEYTKQTCGYLWSEDPWKQEQLELHRLPIVAPRTWSSESWWRSRRPLQSQLLRPSLSLPGLLIN